MLQVRLDADTHAVSRNMPLWLRTSHIRCTSCMLWLRNYYLHYSSFLLALNFAISKYYVMNLNFMCLRSMQMQLVSTRTHSLCVRVCHCARFHLVHVI